MAGTHSSTHPLLLGSTGLENVLDTMVGPDGELVADPAYLSPDVLADLIVSFDRSETRTAALKARLLAAAAAVADRDGFKTAGAWLAAQTHASPARTGASYKLGRRLLRRPATASAYGTGAITSDHAVAVCDTVDQLPASLGRDTINDIESTLVGFCAEHTPREIRRLGAHALEVAAPEEADAILERLLAAEEERARAKTRLSISDRGDGTHSINGIIPSLSATLLAAQLDAFANPARAHHDGDTGGVHEPVCNSAETGDVEVDRLTPAQKRGRALCALIEHLPTDGLPTSGGTPVEVAVTIDADKLRDAAGAAFVGDLAVSAGQARRLLCAHGAFPVVLDGASVVLDEGRSKRLFTTAQVRAARVTRSTCQTSGCQVPSHWCHAHHRDPWSHGGATDLANLVLLCPHHHQRVHDPGYHQTWGRVRDGTHTVRFTRRR